MNIDQSNDISKKIISNFYTNSNLAKQNNILMQELGAIKRQYGISMQGILMRIKVCGILNEHAIKHFRTR